MFDWSGKNANKSGESQGILISCVSGNPDYDRSFAVQPDCVKGLYVCVKQSMGDMSSKDLLISITRVGYCILILTLTDAGCRSVKEAFNNSRRQHQTVQGRLCHV